MSKKKIAVTTSLFIIIAVLFLFTSYILLPGFFKVTYDAVVSQVGLAPIHVGAEVATTTTVVAPVASHIKTPDAIKAIYMTSWVAGTSHLRKGLVDLIDTTELNAVVIDVKDYTGRISFAVNDPLLKSVGSQEIRIADIDSFIESLHQKHIYVIGRISTFQDAYYVKKYPQFAVKRNSDKEIPWTDHKGISWIDAGSKDTWNYIATIGKEAYSHGFDELNFDYIRFPSDGNMKDIYYPWSGTTSKPLVLKSFFKYVGDTFKPLGIPISADLFGMTTTNSDDLNIGQVLENALPYFDFIDPMVYPSHYPLTWNGFKDPEAYPYEVVHISMQKAADRAKAMGVSIGKLRPWLQDFGLRMDYTAPDIIAQMKATYDSGLTSWLLWDAANHYTVGALAKTISTTTEAQ